jgi:hypothetical protein
MNPTVEAAWIAAGVGILSLVGTVTVAIVGYRNTRKVAVEAARNERLVGKMADTYEGVLTALLRRQAERKQAATFYRTPDAEEKMMQYTARRADPIWFEAQGRVIAYSSPEVRRGLELVRGVDQEVAMRFMLWQTAKQQASEARESGKSSEQSRSSDEMRELMNQGIEHAEKIENVLIDLVRAELQGKDTAEPTNRLSALVRNHPYLLAGYEE